MAIYTMGQYTALVAAIAASVTSASYQGKSVQYRDLQEMLMLKRLMEADLGIGSPVKRQFRPVTWKHL